MAVSHQWFIQWASPSMVYADISKQYDSMNHRWNQYDHNEWTSVIRTESGYNRYDYAEPYSPPERPVYEKNNDYEARGKHKYSHEHMKAAGMTLSLWWAMLGLANPRMIVADNDTPPFSTLYKWKHIDFEFPSLMHRERTIKNGKYIAANVMPLGLEVWASRVFVTLPSWRRGVPATLATLSRFGGVASPLLNPYPDWTYHRAYGENNCNGLISVFRVNADPCGRLWVLDSGQIDSQDDPKQICPPSIVIFDLETDKILARYRIPKKYVLQDSLFSNIVVDTRRPDCSDLHVYVADTWRFGLLVFRERDQKFWRITHHLFYPDPIASNYTLHDLNFQWTDGIFGLSLSPVPSYGERFLFFHAMSSYSEFYVSTDVIQDPERVNKSATEYHTLGESRGLHGQSSASFVDRRGVMFYGLVTQDSIGCWDTAKPYGRSTLGTVAKNSDTLVFPNDIKVDQEERQGLWVISNRLPMFQAGSLDPDDYNYRILFADTIDAVRDTICDPEKPAILPITASFHNKK